MHPTVSAVVTTYNQARYIEATLESVLRQTYSPYEVIVVDDGSTDETPERVGRFGERVRYIRQANQGVAASRNTGVAHARGEYIALLDGDDLWERDKLAVQTEVACEYPDAGLIVADGVEFGDTGVLEPSLLRDVALELRLDEGATRTVPYYGSLLRRNDIWTVSQVMIPRKVLQHVGPSDQRLKCASDYDLYLRIAERWEVTFIKKRLVKWRYVSTSASGPRRLRQFRYAVDNVVLLRTQLRKASHAQRPLIRKALAEKIRTASEAVFYHGRRDDRLFATRQLWRLFCACGTLHPLILSVALWLPPRITTVVAPAIRGLRR